jgi:SpoIID/LytB domain protein
LIEFDKEPLIRVGLISGAQSVRLTLSGSFVTNGDAELIEGDYVIEAAGESVKLSLASESQKLEITEPAITISPLEFDSSRITVHDVTIGINFHWQRRESQQFQGAIKFIRDKEGLTVINELPLESYLISVISSEMSAACPQELLRAHAVVSRSWLLAQFERRESGIEGSQSKTNFESTGERIRWYDRESHDRFDVCADDHCQRYQGISKAYSQETYNAVSDTRGLTLVYGEEICDARYSKSCGGMTEIFSSAWEEKDVPYLPAIYDGAGDITGYQMPLSREENAEAWIRSSPVAYCDTQSAEILSRILPDFDQETRDFYRWNVNYTQEELSEIIRARTGINFGPILALEPVERGQSGRVIKLRIVGQKLSLVIGKELEIRRALSRSHLYSSAFVVRAEPGSQTSIPEKFSLTGAGWGHGVGLCQIGAAVMADLGHAHTHILSHYFRNAELKKLY